MLAPDCLDRSSAAFLDALGQSGLLTGRQIETIAGRSVGSSAVALADRFIQAGLLTTFQTQRLLAGKTHGYVLGPYAILEPIGGGKTIFRARHLKMKRTVAIKWLAKNQNDATLTAIRQAVQLLHPNIVTTYDANECAGRTYTVLEYLAGESLADRVRKTGRFSVAAACACARQTARALQHAHDRAMAHGLINPDNVFIGPEDCPDIKILNFGYSALASAAGTVSNRLDGAIAAADYLAPELFESHTRPSPASDLFSLGCLLHFLLAGHAPRGDRPIHQFAIRRGIECWRPGIDSELKQLVHELLQQDPRARPSSAAAVADRLDALEHNRGTVEYALPQAPAPQGPTPFDDLHPADPGVSSPRADRAAIQKMGRSRWIAGSAAGVLLLAAAVIAVTGSAVALVLRSAVR